MVYVDGNKYKLKLKYYNCNRNIVFRIPLIFIWQQIMLLPILIYYWGGSLISLKDSDKHNTISGFGNYTWCLSQMGSLKQECEKKHDFWDFLWNWKKKIIYIFNLTLFWLPGMRGWGTLCKDLFDYFTGTVLWITKPALQTNIFV